MAASVTVHPHLIPCFSPKLHSSLKPCKLSSSISSFPILPYRCHSQGTVFCPAQKNSRKCARGLVVSAASGDVLPGDAQIENTQQLVSSDDGIGSTMVTALLSFAFVGLVILTIGVIYIAVSDFLQKREREKFEKEEAANKKKSGKKKKVKAQTGPRGFGQKLEEDDD